MLVMHIVFVGMERIIIAMQLQSKISSQKVEEFHH